MHWMGNPSNVRPSCPKGGIVLLYPNAMCLGLLAQPPTAEQMEALLDGLLTLEERVIWGPDGMEPLTWLQEVKPDVLFLDAAHGGMELSARLRAEGHTLPVILLTDDYEQVMAGYRLSAGRCVMKPPERDALEEALEFCRSACGRESFQVSLTKGETRIIRFSEILWFRGRGHKLFLYMEGRAGPLELGMDIPPLERILPANFVRCHNSTTVNTDKIHTLERTAVILTDGSRVPVSRRKYEKVRSQYIASMRLCMQ